jgi:hypothetical protein
MLVSAWRWGFLLVGQENVLQQGLQLFRGLAAVHAAACQNLSPCR